MKNKVQIGLCAMIVPVVLLVLSACTSVMRERAPAQEVTSSQMQEVSVTSSIAGVSDEVYARGLAFIEKMDTTQMIGQAEGEEQLDAVAEEDGTDTELLFEDDLYILWVYHNLKSIDSAAEEMNVRRKKAGIEQSIQQEYAFIRQRILDARTQDDLWAIWNDIKAVPSKQE